MPRTSTSISKTRFQAGLRCQRRLWLESYHRELATLPDRAARLRMAAGHRIGELARGCWPEGRLVEVAAARHRRAVEVTRELLADVAVPAIFEAAFEADGVRIRADAIVRTEAGFDLYEVKSSSRVKDEHITDVAVQLHAIEGQGIPVTRVFLMHLDPRTVWNGGRYDPHALFTAADITEQVRAASARVAAELPAMREVLARDDEPDIDIGRRCRRPYPCPFIAHCWRHAPVHPVTELPRAGDDLLDLLRADGVDDIAHMPAGRYPLTELQETVRRSVVSGEVMVKRKPLRRALATIASPVTYLDFETFAPPLPIYPGTHPHEVIPFQWSAHIEAADGSLRHEEFLWTDAGDPRPRFIDSLLAALPGSGSIVVYSGYEQQRLEALAARFPQSGRRLLDRFRPRVVDLLAVVRGYVYHPRFHGSHSLKRVLPALVPGRGYERLAVADGADAAAAYAELIASATDPERRRQLENALRDYCRADTRGEVDLVAALRAMSRSAGPNDPGSAGPAGSAEGGGSA
ncbi:MAG: DUF2779 domain-containing protein [Candidatus Binatia bacterium]